MRTLKLIITSICAVVATVACSKGSKGGGATAPAVTYYLSNNVCYDARTNQSVSSNNCSTLAYYFNGNTCYASANRSAVDMANCQALVGQYYLINNSCWDKNTNNYASNTNACYTNNGTGNGQYQWRNNVCVDVNTGWTAPNSSYCGNNNGYNNNDPHCLQQGRYIYTDYYGQTLTADCTRYNCRGAMLFDNQTRTWVTCQ